MELPCITNIQKYSIHDGKGIRTTVFFKGCPLSCRWCHNPETQRYGKELFIYEERCTGCGSCTEGCPSAAVREEADRTVTEREKCTLCGECCDRCVSNARELCGSTWEVRELIKELLKDRPFYETSGGGVTLSGGEVLAQDMDYVVKLMRELVRRGVRVNVDTCGAVSYEAFERVMPYTDVFLYDLKLMEEEKHRFYTGQGNRSILENLKRLSAEGARLWIRIPVIGGVNNDLREMGRICEFLKSCEIRPEQINLIPYHNTGSGKYSRLGREYEGGGLYVPLKEELEGLRTMIADSGIAPVFIGG